MLADFSPVGHWLARKIQAATLGPCGEACDQENKQFLADIVSADVAEVLRFALNDSRIREVTSDPITRLAIGHTYKSSLIHVCHVRGEVDIGEERRDRAEDQPPCAV